MQAQPSASQHEKHRLINLLASYGFRDPILSAFDEVPRELFIDSRYRYAAYEDHALPIGEGQTISQPSLVAAMLDALQLSGSEKVLEIGTGSGFQAALLGKLARSVWSIERLPRLAAKAQKRIKSLGIKNVEVVLGDGTKGLPEHAPYDAIIVTAASEQVPQPLVEQLKEQGLLVMPVGTPESQNALLYEKREGKLSEVKNIAAVRFVPLVAE